MTTLSPDAVLAALKRIKGPDLDSNIVDLGLVAPPFVRDGRVTVSITVAPERAQELEPLRQAAEKVANEVEGITGVTAVLTAEATKGGARPAAKPATGAAKKASAIGAPWRVASAAAYAPSPK